MIQNQTQAEKQIIEQGYQALVDALGVANTIRFLQHINPGKGNYTEERRKLIENLTLEDIRKMPTKEDDLSRYDEVIY